MDSGGTKETSEKIPLVKLDLHYDRLEYSVKLARALDSIIEEQDRKAYEMLYGKEEKVNSKSQMKREAVQKGKSLEEAMAKAHERGAKFAEQFDEHQTKVLLDAQKKKEREDAEVFMMDLRTEDNALARAELEHVWGMRLRLQFLPPAGSQPGQKYEAPDLQEALDELLAVAFSEGFKETLLGAVDGCVSVKVS